MGMPASKGETEEIMKITEKIQCIACNDSSIDLFESQYVVPHGVSYNSYVISDEKVAVLDTADRRVSEEWFTRIEEALAGRQPDYLVVSHLEPDHAYNIGKFLEKYPTAKIVGNDKTFGIFFEYFSVDVEGRKVTVKEGDELSLGECTLRFVMAPMVHWPEVMMCYEKNSKTLFSADAFGKFGTIDREEAWTDEARRYYCNIVGKYGISVQSVLKKAATLEIERICPLHGPVLSGDLSLYLDKYDRWSRYEPEEEGVVIAYASIHGNTAAAAEYLARELSAQGKTFVLFDLSRSDLSEVVAQTFRYGKLVLACSTYDGGIFSPMADFLHRLKAKNVQRRQVALIENGSWAPMSGKLMGEVLSAMKGMEVVAPTVTIRGTMSEANRAELKNLANIL